MNEMDVFGINFLLNIIGDFPASHISHVVFFWVFFPKHFGLVICVVTLFPCPIPKKARGIGT